MAKLANFVVIDNSKRISLGLKASTDDALNAYSKYFKQAVGLQTDHDLSKTELIEQILRQFMADDREFLAVYPEGKKLMPKV